jgi:hypothetical protein
MHDAARVRRRERAEHVAGQRDRLGHRQPLRDHPSERHAVEQLHDDVRAAVAGEREVVHGHAARVLDHRCGARFDDHALAIGVIDRMVQQLDRDDRAVPRVDRAINGPERTTAELREHAVLAEPAPQQVVRRHPHEQLAVARAVADRARLVAAPLAIPAHSESVAPWKARVGLR